MTSLRQSPKFNAHGMPKPLLVYDGECDFCRYCIARWRHVTEKRIRYAPYQEVAAQFPQIPLSAFQNAVQLILPDGTVLSGAAAVFHAFGNRRILWCYENVPGFAPMTEGVYRFVARHRAFFSKVTRKFWKT